MNPRRNSRSAGFTIIELSIVIMVMMAVAVAVFMSVGSIFRADVKAESGKIAAAVRYLYSLSVLNNQSYRLVINLETGEYWGEELDNDGNPCNDFLFDDPDAMGKSKRQRDQELEDPEATRLAREGSFKKVKANMLSKRKLPNDVRFLGAVTTAVPVRTEQGNAAVHFFSNGYVEHAYLYLGEEDDLVFTVETMPLQGTAVVHREELSPDEFGKDQS